MGIRRFEDIEAWQMARNVTRTIYRLSGRDRFAKDWGLRDQVRNAAGSAMHNIAEGFDAGSNAEFLRFLSYAQRSCTEVQSELYVALDQSYLTQADFDSAYQQVALTRLKIGAFIKYLRSCGIRKPSACRNAPEDSGK